MIRLSLNTRWRGCRTADSRTAFVPAHSFPRFVMTAFAAAILMGVLFPLSATDLLDWKTLPPLPDQEGFAGAFAGISKGHLLVAGGANFPGKKPWEGGSKIWYDQVYALDLAGGQWRRAGVLPQPNGYGVSITTAEGVVCVGGGDATANFSSVVRLRWVEGMLQTETLPALPKACAFMAGTQMGSHIYIAGGIETPAATKALPVFWALDLRRLEAGWQELPTWPGPERILACMASHDGSVFLFSGARLKAGPNSQPLREWLQDAYRYTPSQGWRKISDLPRVAVAAPSPAPVLHDQILVLGGDDGALVDFEPKDQHPGFPRDVLVYHPERDVWSRAGAVPFSLVTTPAIAWGQSVVIPGGEARPGKRSPEVWLGKWGPKQPLTLPRATAPKARHSSAP